MFSFAGSTDRQFRVRENGTPNITSKLLCLLSSFAAASTDTTPTAPAAIVHIVFDVILSFSFHLLLLILVVQTMIETAAAKRERKKEKVNRVSATLLFQN